MTVGGVLKATYTTNGLEQVAIRVLTNMTPSGTTHFIYDRNGNPIAETKGGGATGATGTVREYIWLPETEIAPTMGSRTVVDRPIAVVNAVNTLRLACLRQDARDVAGARLGEAEQATRSPQPPDQDDRQRQGVRVDRRLGALG